MTQTTIRTDDTHNLIAGPALEQQVTSLLADDQWHRHAEALALLQQAGVRIRELELVEKEQAEKIAVLENLASTDPLTGLMNRRGFEQFFLQEQERARRHNTFGSVLILIDLDSFKAINDTYGHQAGDACLVRVAEYLRRKVRGIDAAARLGGDEFALLLSHTDIDRSAHCLDEIRNALREIMLHWKDTTLHIKASCGAKQVSDNVSYETAVAAADKALYNAKRENKES